MKTSKEYTIKNFMGFGKITVPKGVKLTHITAMGIDENYHFVDSFGWIDENYPSFANILKMDARNYGINIPIEYVEK